MSDRELLQKINAAVEAANATEQSARTAQDEHVSRSKALGLLLLEAKRRHPPTTEFKAFLKQGRVANDDK
jgi:hypothetical protein